MLNYSMKLIFGLGNPDKKYQATRHNLGQKFIRQYLDQCYLSLAPKKTLLAEICEVGQGSQKNIFAISTGYINNSGQTIQKLVNFYKLDPQDILVVHDDLDLPVGEYRIQFDRGPAGHNGINLSLNISTLKPFTVSESALTNQILPSPPKTMSSNHFLPPNKK